ncbi:MULTISPECIES: hypothetical protein [Cyanophyceae]|uniref:hypothetical protein n=1 Tax=Cyanophyceae TaxID=3028117 RepID=UPI001688AF44|nr:MULTISPECIES: hypothetical protein [Cyanophyceae]MBD1914878.1 hypothetical protein [Phormidium sp. FACHB-77]MBD2028556.1 hypothetical protein [Phormidium sp. FACHB-322]MBD2051800.1 hypothetical protein [Leptolyngbya sp. FACHB-60]
MVGRQPKSVPAESAARTKPISSEEAFRQSWAETDPAIAPFLGTWVRDWNLMPYDFLTVLPSTVLGQVCLVRYRQMKPKPSPLRHSLRRQSFRWGGW